MNATNGVCACQLFGTMASAGTKLSPLHFDLYERVPVPVWQRVFSGYTGTVLARPFIRYEQLADLFQLGSES